LEQGDGKGKGKGKGGRIAECPRLQQNGSSGDLSFSCKNVGSSML